MFETKQANSDSVIIRDMIQHTDRQKINIAFTSTFCKKILMFYIFSS